MTGWRMELGENNNTTHPPLIPYSKRRRHSWLCVVNGIVSDSIHPWDLGFVPWRQAAGTGGKSKTPSRGFYRNSAFAFVFFILFCSVIALDEMGFIPGNVWDILVLSWFREVRGLQTSCSWSGGWGITCCGSLTLVVCPSPSCQHLLVELLRHRVTSLSVLWGLFSCRDFNPWCVLLVESVCVTVS